MEEECNSCFRSSTQTKLDRCLFPNCPHSNKLFCDSCGPVVHRNVSDHKFQSEIQIRINQQESKEQKTDASTNKSTNKSNDNSLINFSSLIPSKDKIKKCEDAAATVLASQNPVLAIGGVGLQVAQVSYNYYHDEIVDEKGDKDKEEYIRLLFKSSCIPISSCVFGAAAKAICLTTGFGWVAAIGYGILGSILSQKAFEKFLPKSKQKRRELKLTALRTFQFFPQDLENKDIFNKKTIEKRYKKLAKKYHPDAKYGSKEKFQELEVYHRIVLSILDDDTVFPMVKFDENGVAYFDSTTQPKPIQYIHNQQNNIDNRVCDNYNESDCFVM